MLVFVTALQGVVIYSNTLQEAGIASDERQ
jgi:hypothetical protein